MNWRNPSNVSETGTQTSPGRRFHLALATVVLVGTGCLALAIVFSSCGAVFLAIGPMKLAGRKLDETVEHGRGPVPESEWNGTRVWRRISDHPPTYLPFGYGSSLPCNERTGTWVVDKRDGKRLFVPNNGVNGYSHAVLMADAQAATNWRFRSKITIMNLYTNNDP